MRRQRATILRRHSPRWRRTELNTRGVPDSLCFNAAYAVLPIPMNELLQENVEQSRGANVRFDVTESQVLLTLGLGKQFPAPTEALPMGEGAKTEMIAAHLSRTACYDRMLRHEGGVEHERGEACGWYAMGMYWRNENTTGLGPAFYLCPRRGQFRALPVPRLVGDVSMRKRCAKEAALAEADGRFHRSTPTVTKYTERQTSGGGRVRCERKWEGSETQAMKRFVGVSEP
jgi:hypothetical protein